MSINIHIQKKDLWLLSAIAVFLIGVAYVIAYDWTTGSGTGPPSIHGHTANEIEGLTGGGSCSLGDWTTTGTLSSGGEETFVRDHVYVAQTDGFVIAIGAAVGSGDSQSIFIIYSDSNNPPTTKKYRFIQQLSGSGRNIAPTGVIPVKKGDYFNVTYTYGGNNQPISAIYWIPLNCGGSGSNVLSGSWCGLKMSSHINPIKTCDGHNPQVDCPSGYTSTLFAEMGAMGGNWYSCFKD